MPDQIYQETINVVTDASGDFVGYSDKLNGKYLDRFYIDNVDLGASANLTITDEDTGAVLYTEQTTVVDINAPVRFANTTTAGAAISGSYSAWRTNGRIKVVVDTGGDTKTANIHIFTTDQPPAQI